MRVNPKDIIFKLKENHDRIRQTARDLGISPSTVLYWQSRARSGRLAYAFRYSTRGLERRSTRPKSVHSTSLSVNERAVLISF